MTIRKPAGVIRQPSSSGSRDKDGLEFIRCVGGQEPQIQELWSFSEDGITRKVHPFARIDVGNFSGDYFHTVYATEIARRVFIYGWKSINGSVKWIGVPDPSCGTGVAWTENIFVPNSCWGDGHGYERWASANRSRPRFGGRSVPWRGAVTFHPSYVPSSPENAHARARRIHAVHLRERRLAQAQALLRDLHFDGDERGNGPDDSLDDWLDEQWEYFSFCNSVGSVHC